MNADTTIDLEALMAAVVSGIQAAFPAFATVNDFDAVRTSLAIPACLVTLEDFEAEPEADPLTGQLAVLIRWRARVIIGFKTPNAKRQIRKLAASVGYFIHGQRWGLPVEAAAVTVIAPDDFEPALDQFEVWSVDFQQMVNLGESVFGSGEDFVPETVLVSWVPDIGIPHEDVYVELVP